MENIYEYFSNNEVYSKFSRDSELEFSDDVANIINLPPNILYSFPLLIDLNKKIVFKFGENGVTIDGKCFLMLTKATIV